MKDRINRLAQLLKTAPRKNLVAFAAIVIFAAAVPLTVFVSQKQQNLQQHASGGVDYGCGVGKGTACYGGAPQATPKVSYNNKCYTPEELTNLELNPTLGDGTHFPDGTALPPGWVRPRGIFGGGVSGYGNPQLGGTIEDFGGQAPPPGVSWVDYVTQNPSITYHEVDGYPYPVAGSAAGGSSSSLPAQYCLGKSSGGNGSGGSGGKNGKCSVAETAACKLLGKTCDATTGKCSGGGNPTPTAKPTKTPTPTSTPPPPTPVGSPTPVPTAGPGVTALAINIGLDGIGNFGDNRNKDASSSNKNPKTTNRTITVTLQDPNDNSKIIAGPINGNVIYNPSTGTFQGVIPIPSSVASGPYRVVIKSPGYLSRALPGNWNVVKGISNPQTLAPIGLIGGDFNGDDVIDILDYGLFNSCYIYTANQANCTPALKQMTDLTDNGGNPDFDDYTLFGREYESQHGAL